MTDLTSTLASFQRLAEETKAAEAAVNAAVSGPGDPVDALEEYAEHVDTAAPLLASAVLELVEVVRLSALASADHMKRGCGCDLCQAFARLSALSPKEGE